MAIKNYDPKQVIVTMKGFLLQGFMDGTFLTVERNEDTFEPTVGAGGEVTRTRKRNRTGTITLTLQAESPSNAVLSNLAKLDELSGLGYGPIQVTNLNSDSLATAPNAWVSKPPNMEFADTASGREWVIHCDELDMFLGGALV